MTQTIENYQDNLQVSIRDYGKSLRRLIIAAVIIGSAIWYSDYSTVVNVADVPVNTIESDATGPAGAADTNNGSISDLESTGLKSS